MLSKLILAYKKQQFIPKWYSVWLNPFYIIRKALYNDIATLAPQLGHGRLLDFGCGAKPYRTLFDVEEYVGLDMENPGHPHLTEDVDVFYDGKNIPFPNNHFSAVLSSEVLEHVFEPDHILSEINRVLKPDAKGLFTVPFVWNEHEIPFDYARYSAYGLEHLFKKHGFEILEIRRSTHFFQTLIQLHILYWYQLLETRNKFLNLLITAVCISPFTIIGILLSKVFPKRNGFYHNLIILVKKKA